MNDPHMPPSSDAVRAGQPPSPDQVAPGFPYNRQPAPAPAQPAPAKATSAKASSTTEYKDGTREIVETIVFVVVLVLLLKTFLAEAFVIPTGSMATTLLGYHKDVICDQCRYPFLVNASEEVEGKPPSQVVEWTCPNCRFQNRLDQKFIKRE